MFLQPAGRDRSRSLPRDVVSAAPQPRLTTSLTLLQTYQLRFQLRSKFSCVFQDVFEFMDAFFLRGSFVGRVP